MWILEGHFTGNKDTKQKRLVLPGRIYSVGRNEYHDFSIPAGAVSRNSCTIKVGPWNGHDTPSIEVTVLGDPPSTVKPGKRSLGFKRVGEDKKTMLEQGQVWQGQPDDIVAVSAKLHIRLVWQAFELQALLRNKIPADTKAAISKIGGLIAPEDHFPHTHYYTKFIKPFNLIESSIRAAHIVSEKFLKSLVSSASINSTAYPLPSQDIENGDSTREAVLPSRKKWKGYCALEKDFDQFWPDEKEFFPEPSLGADGEDTLDCWDANAWQPDERRMELLGGYSFVAFGKNILGNKLKEPIEIGKEDNPIWFMPYDAVAAEPSDEANADDIYDTIKSHQNQYADPDKFVFILSPDLDSDAEIRRAAEMMGITTIITLEILVKCLYTVNVGLLQPSKRAKQTESNIAIQSQAQESITANGASTRSKSSTSQPQSKEAEPSVAKASTSSTTRSTRSQRGKQPQDAQPEPEPEPEPEPTAPAPQTKKSGKLSAREDAEKRARDTAEMPPPHVPAQAQIREAPPAGGKRMISRRAKTQSHDVWDDDPFDEPPSAPPSLRPTNGGSGSGTASMEIDPITQPTPIESLSKPNRRMLSKRKLVLDDDDFFGDEDGSSKADTTASKRPRIMSDDENSDKDAPPKERVLPSSLLDLDGTGSESQMLLPPTAQKNSQVAGTKRKAGTTLTVSDAEVEDVATPQKKKSKSSKDSRDLSPAAGDKTTKGGKKPASSKEKTTSKTGDNDKDAGKDKEKEKASGKVLKVEKRGTRKITEMDEQFNKEFNNLKIVRPAVGSAAAPKPKVSQRIGWKDEKLDEEERDQMMDWDDADAGKSFFQVKLVNMIRPKKERIPPRTHDQSDGRGDLQDFKKFRPKESEALRAKRKPNMELVLVEAQEFGVDEDQGNRRVRERIFDSQTQEQDAESDEEPVPQRRARRTQPSAKAPSATKSKSATASSATLDVDEGAEEEEDDAPRTLTGRSHRGAAGPSNKEPSQRGTQGGALFERATKKTAPAASRNLRETVVEEEDEDVFGGFTGRTTRAKRKRG